jgi:hypothetical protein
MKPVLVSSAMAVGDCVGWRGKMNAQLMSASTDFGHTACTHPNAMPFNAMEIPHSLYAA